MGDWLNCLADLASILTGLAALAAWGYYLRAKADRCRRLENYLREQRRKAEVPGAGGSGTHTIVHLMGNCAMTEAQILEAAFSNRKIRSWVAVDPETKRADTLMFQYHEQAR